MILCTSWVKHTLQRLCFMSPALKQHVSKLVLCMEGTTRHIVNLSDCSSHLFLTCLKPIIHVFFFGWTLKALPLHLFSCLAMAAENSSLFFLQDLPVSTLLAYAVTLPFHSFLFNAVLRSLNCSRCGKPPLYNCAFCRLHPCSLKGGPCNQAAAEKGAGSFTQASRTGPQTTALTIENKTAAYGTCKWNGRTLLGGVLDKTGGT